MGILRADRITGLGGANAIKGSVNFTGSRYAESYFDIDASTDFAFGTGDFTIECWVNFTHDDADSYYKRVYMTDGPTGNASGNFQIAIAPSTGVVNLWEDGSALDVSGSTKVTKVGWVHIAAVRSGSGSNNLKLYVNGVQDLQTTYTTSISPNSGNPRPRIGAYAKDQGGSLPGHVSNLRVSNEALYTSAFTVPTTELTKLSNTILLCFQSPSNILKEETDKILIPRRNNTNGAFPSASRFTPNTPVGFSTTTDVGSQYGTTFDGFTVFATSTYMVPPSGNTRERNRGRGVMSGGETPSRVNTIAFTHIQSSGTFQDFGDLIGGDAGETRGVGSSTRGVFFTNHGGSSGQAEDLEFITFANQSNGTDFGDLPSDHPMRGSAGNETRGIFAGGYKSSLKDQIEFITIATTGNGTDFGNLTGTRNAVAGLASPTRALFGGGSSPSNVNEIDFVTIATTGNASDFGDLTRTGKEMGGVASNTRGVFAGARINPSTASNVIDFVTIASAGNAIDFGDLTQIVASPASMTDSVRGLFAGGYTPSPSFSRFNSIDFINIATIGNASDFGDLTYAQNYGGGCSDSHGGL